jgi:hypothetical protein
MKTKLVAVFLIVTVLSLSMIAIAQSQPIENSRGGLGVEASEVRGKPAKPPGSGGKPSSGIATGNAIPLQEGAGRYAIVIGINYVGTSSELRYCVNDAAEFKGALLDNGWQESEITYLTNGGATYTAIMDAITAVSNAADENDEVIFFYSGHGSVSNYDVDNDGERKDECIVPVELTSATLIWDGDLKQAFSLCKSQRMLFYFDSCYSGGMTDLSGAGRLVLMACGENQLSLESSSWQNGQFTYYFVDQGINLGLADKDGLNGVTFEEAFDYAKANCIRQTPVASDGFTDDMLP